MTVQVTNGGADLSFCRRRPAEKPTRPAGKASGLNDNYKLQYPKKSHIKKNILKYLKKIILFFQFYIMCYIFFDRKFSVLFI